MPPDCRIHTASEIICRCIFVTLVVERTEQWRGYYKGLLPQVSQHLKLTGDMFTVLAILALIIAIPFVGALFIKREYSIKREIVIEQPVARVFDYIKHLKNQDHYSKWVMTDP